MRRPKSFSEIRLDNDGVDKLVTAILDVPPTEGESLIHTRIRYLQRIGFPGNRDETKVTGERRKRRRADHDLNAILELTLALTMIEFGIPAGRAMATVVSNANLVSKIMVCGWRALGIFEKGPVSKEDYPEFAERVNMLRLVLLFNPRAISQYEGALPLVFQTPGCVASPLSGEVRPLEPWIVVDAMYVVERVVSGLETVQRFRRDEIDEAFLNLGAAAFPNKQTEEWFVTP